MHWHNLIILPMEHVYVRSGTLSVVYTNPIMLLCFTDYTAWRQTSSVQCDRYVMRNFTLSVISRAYLSEKKTGQDNYLQPFTGTTFISLFKLLISEILALYTLYASGISLWTSNPFFGGGGGPLGFPSASFILCLARRLNSSTGIGNGFFSLLE